MGTSQLSLYQKALKHLEERPLSSLAENREPRRLLDAEYTDALETCLQSGFWKFALRMVMASPDAAQTPNFGRKYSYTKPSDWVRTYQVSCDDRFHLLDRYYIDGNNTWFSDLPYFYVRYVSNDSNFGLNLSAWPPAFVEYVGCYLAFQVCPRIKQALEKKADIAKDLKMLKAQAMAIDAMDAPPGKIEYGTWTRSRTPRGSIYSMGGGWDDC